MTEVRDALAAALTADMRTPLARVELAATQLARDATTPADRELAAGISDAVAEIDQMIHRALEILLPREPDPTSRVDVVPILERVCARVAPALEARGISWSLGAVPTGGVVGDPRLIEQAALALLRGGVAIAGSGGSLRMRLDKDADRYGVAVETVCAPGVPSEEEWRRAFDGARDFALGHAGMMALVPDSEPPIAAIAFAR